MPQAFLTNTRLLRRPAVHVKLLDQVSDFSGGEWVDISGLYPITVSVEGSFLATCDVRVSNEIYIDNGNHGVQIGSDITDEPGAVTITAPFRLVKVRITSFTSGAVSAFVFAG